MTIRRRDLFVMGGIIALIYGLRALPWDRLGGRGLSYVDIEGVPPFRRLELAGQTSTANIALVGLDGPLPDAGARRARMETLRTRWMIDATGRAAFLGSKLGLIDRSVEHPTAALWCRWRDVRHHWR